MTFDAGNSDFARYLERLLPAESSARLLGTMVGSFLPVRISFRLAGNEG